MKFLAMAMILSVLAAWLPAGAMADNADRDGVFPSSIEWIIPFSAGGGSDRWAHFLAPLLQRHLPGNPPVEVINQAGGGGTRGANIFAQHAKPDGAMILGTSGSTLFPYLLGDFRVQYDYDDWDVLATSPTGGVVFVSSQLGLNSWQDIGDLRDRRLVFASQGPTSLDLVPFLAFRLLGLNVQYVFGYTGRHDGLQAMIEGDVNIDYQTTPSVLHHLMPSFHDGDLVPLMTWGVMGADGKTRRDPTFPNLPTVEEVYEYLHGQPPSGPDYDAYRVFFIAGFAAQKMVVIPSDTPEPLRLAWLGAWQALLDDPDFRTNAPDALGAYPLLVGSDAEDLARQALHIDPEIRALVHDILAHDFSIRLSE